MPAIMTHDFFGKDAWDAVAKARSYVTLAEHEAFLLGNQGPDPLFYLLFDPKYKNYQHLGNMMHHVRTTTLLQSLHDAQSMMSAKEKKIVEAYSSGFMAHYLLDTTMHPYVYTLQYAICDAGVDGLNSSHGQVVHAEIERDLDEMVLYSKTHRTVLDYKPYKEVLRASQEVLTAIDKLYFYLFLWTYSVTVPQDLYTHAVKSFRLAQRLLYSPKDKARFALSHLERGIGKRTYSLYSALSHHARQSDVSDFDNREHKLWINCFSGEREEASFWDLYKRAQDRLLPSLEALYSTQFAEGAAADITKHNNFSGEPEEQSVAPDTV